MANKTFDITLIGATGFTGKRAARYLHDHAPDHLNWAIAARNPQKLFEVAGQLNLPKAHTFIVDTLNREQVQAVVQQSKIIVSTVGPFSLYGEFVIEACARFGTHYLDITGETSFIKKMADTYGEAAQKNGAILIPFSGFDSVPADIAAFLLSKKFQNPDILDIRSYYTIRGGVNGGTVASMLHKFESGEHKEVNKPDELLHEGTAHIHKPARQAFFGFDRAIGRWSTPFIMGLINSKVVYKTAEIKRTAGLPYAQSVAYSEHASLGKWYNPFSFKTTSLILICLSLLGPKKWFQNFLRKIMPAPGEGPSEEAIEQGFFKLKAIATDRNNHTSRLELFYPGDPGNKSTVFFLCESALLLFSLLDGKGSPPLPGFQTPVSAFGEKLPNRLKDKGLEIEFVS